MNKVELIRNLFKNFHYSHFWATTDSDKYEIIMAGSNWILKTEDTKKELLFFISVRSFISKLSGEKIDVKEINKNVAEMLERAIQDDEILQIGEIHNSNRLSILSDEILNKLAKMQKKNIAVEILNRALKEYAKQVGKENIIQEMINLKNEIKYNYPPNKSEKAVQTVIKQAELKCHTLIEK